MSSTDDSSTDDETNLELLKEAADEQFINDSMFKKNYNTKLNESILKIKNLPPSLRRTNIEDDNNEFNKTTPEFRNYIAKKLAGILNENLEEVELPPETINNPKKEKKRRKDKTREKMGIKLLKTSLHYLNEEEFDEKEVKTTPQKILNKNNKKRRKLLEDNEEIEDEEKCKLVAVNPNDILNKTETKFWSKRSKAPIYKYKKTKSGLLIEI